MSSVGPGSPVLPVRAKGVRRDGGMCAQGEDSGWDGALGVGVGVLARVVAELLRKDTLMAVMDRLLHHTADAALGGGSRTRRRSRAGLHATACARWWTGPSD